MTPFATITLLNLPQRDWASSHRSDALLSADFNRQTALILAESPSSSLKGAALPEGGAHQESLSIPSGPKLQPSLLYQPISTKSTMLFCKHGSPEDALVEYRNDHNV